MYKCPKCGSTGHKERIEITNEEGGEFALQRNTLKIS